MSWAVRQGRDNKTVFRMTRKVEDQLQRVIRHGWFNYLKALKKEANRQTLLKDKRGRIYIVRGPSGRRRRHKSSGPGQPHANIRGTLRKSLSWKVWGHERASFGYGVSTGAKNKAPKYATWLEGGTRKMAPRPTLHWVVRREDVEEHWDKAFDEEFKF